MIATQRAMHLDQQVGKWSGRIGLFLAGWLACSAYYGTLHLREKEQTLQTVQTSVLPKLKAAANCQTTRARVATRVAVASENGQDADLRDIPNCPLPPKVPAQLATPVK